MIYPSILLQGDTAACARHVPWTKRRHIDLCKRLGRVWVWRRWVGGVFVELQRNGPVGHIRIVAALSGIYEFATVIDIENVDPDGGAPGVFTVAALGWDSEGDRQIVATSRRGGRITLANAPRHPDLRDRWLFAGDYGEPYTGSNFYPTQEWFELPVVENDIEAAERNLADGRRAPRVIFWRGYRSRHYDLSLWHPRYLGVITPEGSTYTIDAARKSRRSGLSVANSAEAEGSTGHFPRAAGSAWQDDFLLAASWRGDDFKFEARKETYEDYIAGSVFFTLTPPAWVTGDVFTPWYFRGDGKRCVSLQYGKVFGEEDPLAWTLENYDDDIDAGFVEAQIILNGTVEDAAPGIESGGFINEQHNLGEIGIHPVAIDYDILDQRRKRGYFFRTYIGPIRSTGYIEDETYPERSRTTYARDVLVYLVCAIIDDSFPGEEEWRLPVWHGRAWTGHDSAAHNANVEDINSDVIPRETLIAGIYWQSGFGYPSITGHMVSGDGEAIHPYLDLRAVIVAMDARAGAVALHYKVDMAESYSAGEQSGEVVPWYGKRWSIWSEDQPRRHDWIRPDLATARANAEFDWMEAEAPPGNCFAYLSEPPLGYTVFEKGSTFDFVRVQTGIQIIMGTVLQQLVYLQAGAGTNSPYRAYNGFRVSPTKSFALIANTRSYFRLVSTTFNLVPTDNGVPIDWWVLDHIEKHMGKDEFGNLNPPLVHTHYDLYNQSRGTDWTPGDISELASACVNGIWVE